MFYQSAHPIAAWLATPALSLPRNRLDFVNQRQTETELQALRASVQRGTPFGGPRWIKRAARELGLESSHRPRGRPRKAKK